MTDALHIGRLRARYRLQRGDDRARDRLDAALGRLVERALEGALRHLGVPEGEEVCLRALQAPVRLSLDATDAAVAEAWAEAVARALRDRLASGEGVVRFRSRRHALLDLVVAAARGDLARSWAWAQLGLWGGGAGGAALAGEAIAAALCALPDAAPAVLSEAARRGALPALLARVPAQAWARVALAALRAHAERPAAAEGLAAEALAAPSGSARAAPGAETLRRAERIAGRAPVATALRQLDTVPAGARRPLAALAALDAEPEALAAAPLELVLDALDRALSSSPPRRASPERAAIAPARSGPAPEAPAARRAPAPAASAPAPEGEAAGDATPPPVEPDAGRATRAGGLLFLLHLVAELEWPRTSCAEGGPLARRSLRWALHALALTLLPVEARDAAALAFCGLSPAAAQPGEAEPPPDAAERAALEALASQLSERLRMRLGRADEPARAVLLETCRRDARIVADPGWLEVRLALDGVDVRVRRAGLDLDPGWLPWIGCVVRFVYA